MLSSRLKTPAHPRVVVNPFTRHSIESGRPDWDGLVALGLEALYAAHDIRNIFSTVVLRLDTLRLAPPAEVAQHAETLQRALDQAIGICDEFVRLGNSNGCRSADDDLRLADLLERCIALLPPPQARRCRYTAPPELRVSGAVTALFRALFNLVHNASRYGNTTIDAGLVSKSLVIHVRDDGPGLPPAIAANPFSGHHRSVHGSGNGLAIAHHLALALGGWLTLVETGKNGSAFALDFPENSRIDVW